VNSDLVTVMVRVTRVQYGKIRVVFCVRIRVMAGKLIMKNDGCAETHVERVPGIRTVNTA